MKSPRVNGKSEKLVKDEQLGNTHFIGEWKQRILGTERILDYTSVSSKMYMLKSNLEYDGVWR